MIPDVVEDEAWDMRLAPFRHILGVGGDRISVTMTSHEAAGWVTDRAGRRYDSRFLRPGV
jgi:alkylated DNA repair dioxygenase AlkB